MSYISDFKGAPLSVFGVNGGNLTTDASLATLLGSSWYLADGREVVLVQVGGTSINSGLLVQSPASIGANHTGLTLSTQAIGDTQITATLGGTLATANQYQGGFLTISAGPGRGQILRIASHPAGTASGTVVFTLEDPLSIATLTATSKGSLTLPQYGGANGTNVSTHGVIVSPASAPTGRIIGATLYPLTASSSTVPSYGFIVKSGIVAVVNVSTTTAGLDLMPSQSVAGNCATYVVATGPRIGTSTVAGEADKAQAINLQL